MKWDHLQSWALMAAEIPPLPLLSCPSNRLRYYWVSTYAALVVGGKLTSLLAPAWNPSGHSPQFASNWLTAILQPRRGPENVCSVCGEWRPLPSGAQCEHLPWDGSSHVITRNRASLGITLTSESWAPEGKGNLRSELRVQLPRGPLLWPCRQYLTYTTALQTLLTLSVTLGYMIFQTHRLNQIYLQSPSSFGQTNWSKP